MAYKKGRYKYSSYLDADSYSENNRSEFRSALTSAAKKLKSNLPEEFRYDIPDLMLRLNPGWLKPLHLKKLTNAFDRIQQGERVKILVSTPPRFSKTEVLLHGIARYMATHKNKEVFYLSYAQDQAEKKSQIVRTYVQALGFDTVKDTNSLATWKLTNGCIFHCAGLAGGQITGKGADLLVIDDPHKDRADVESGAKRERVFNSVTADVFTRLSPTASIIIVHTRWSPDDLIGKLLKNPSIDFEVINLPALDSEGKSTWSERWPTERLVEQKELIANEYDWASLYMGTPRPRGSAIFNEPYYYDELPEGKIYCGVGYDLAYTEKTYADFSVAIVLATDGKNYYLVDLVRKQVDATQFSRDLRLLRNKYPKSIFLSYISGPEKGTVSLLNSTGLNLSFLPANTDKFLRAQSASAAWNGGKIFLPNPENDETLKKFFCNPEEDLTSKRKKLYNFISEVVHFTGVSDPNDDQVDALAGAFAALKTKKPRRNLTSSFPLL